MNSEKMALAAVKALEDKKGLAPVILDVRGMSGVTDFYVIVSGTSAPHLGAMQYEVEHRLKEAGLRKYRASGAPESGWTVLDFLSLVVHFFSPEMRARYAIEDLWKDAPRVGGTAPAVPEVVRTAPEPETAKVAVRRRRAVAAAPRRRPGSGARPRKPRS